MEFKKPIETQIIKDFSSVIVKRIYESTYSEKQLQASKGVIIEVANDGVYCCLSDQTNELIESIFLSIFIRDKRKFNDVYYSGNLSDIALFKDFKNLYSPFGERIKILFGASKLKILARISDLAELRFLYEHNDIEVFFDSITLIKQFRRGEIRYYITDSLNPSLSRLLSKGTLIHVEIDELGWIFKLIQDSGIPVDYLGEKPSLRLIRPGCVLEFTNLKVEKNFISLSGLLRFLYPKSSRKVIYLKNFEIESRVKFFLIEGGFECLDDGVFAVNDVAYKVLVNPNQFINQLSVPGISLNLKFDEKVLSSLKFKNITFKCNFITPDRIVVETNLSKDEFKFLNEALVDESLMARSWLSLNERILNLPFKSLEMFKLFLEYYNGRPKYDDSSFVFDNLNDILTFSFYSFCEGNSAFKLSGFERVKKAIKAITSLEDIDLKAYPFLRDYQIKGVSWLIHLYKHKLGGLLADEMGLGKTVQALVALDWLFNQGLAKKALIVCPTSVVRNWEREAKKFTPSLDVYVFYGPRRKDDLDKLRGSQLILTTYSILRFDEILFSDFEFSIIIIDEAQLIKNVDSVTTRIVKSLKGDVKFALSGTPIENRPLELWSIFDFILERGLGSKYFFKTAIERKIDSDGALRLAKSIEPFILRRLKRDTLHSLPPKVETVEVCEMTTGQRELYETYEANARRLVQSFSPSSRVGFAHIFTALTRLRQICNHPASLPDGEGLEALGSGKLSRLLEMVDQLIANGRKVVIFCQFLEMIRIIRDVLVANSIKVFVFTGATKDRLGLIDEFNSSNDPCCLVMSLKAGGLGINLTGASDVILYDPWWNPQVENQAIDRLHRIGQEKVVFVYRLVTNDTIEARMELIKERKLEIFETVLTGKRGLLNLSVLKNLLE